MCLLHFDSSKRCVCPLYKFLYAFKVVKHFLKHPVFAIDVAVCLTITIIFRSVLVLVINVTKYKCENTQQMFLQLFLGYLDAVFYSYMFVFRPSMVITFFDVCTFLAAFRQPMT